MNDIVLGMKRSGDAPFLFTHAAAFRGKDENRYPHESFDQEKQETGKPDSFEPGFKLGFLRCFGHGAILSTKVGIHCISALIQQLF